MTVECIFKGEKMSYDENYRMVDFHKYCATCKHKTEEGFTEPCNECLSEPIKLYSEKPVKYVEDPKAKKEETPVS